MEKKKMHYINQALYIHYLVYSSQGPLEELVHILFYLLRMEAKQSN